MMRMKFGFAGGVLAASIEQQKNPTNAISNLVVLAICKD